MFKQVTFTLNSDGWTQVKVKDREKLYKMHHFLFMKDGHSFDIEIQESLQGDFTAHADNTTDPHDAIKSLGGSTLQSCLQAMITFLESRSSK